MTDPLQLAGPAEIVAHRGYSARAPENTVAALEMAIAARADALEFDLHAASDGSPYLFHDATLERTTDGFGRIHSTTPEELAGLDAGSWFDPRFAGEPVPPLRDALDAVGTRAGKLYPEIKGYRTLEDVDRIARLFEAADLLERTIFISMEWEALGRCRRACPTARLGYIVERPDRAPEAIERAADDGASLVDFDARILLADPRHAERAVAASVPLAAWTVNDPRDASRLLAMGVPRITTNEVDALVAWRDGLRR